MLTLWILVYGLIVALGGIFGYLKARSQASLISGLGSGAALVVAWLIALRSPQIGLGLAALIGLLLVVVFVRRYLETRKLMPAGILALLSLVATIAFVTGLF